MTTRTASRLALVAAIAAASSLVFGSPVSSQELEPRPDLVFERAGEIHVRSPGGATRRLTRNRVWDGLPAWSPDRRRIVFVRAARGDSDIWVMDADGSHPRRLVGSAPRAQDLYPRFSPDGASIVFSSNRGDREPELYVMRADGTKVRRLTRTPRFVQNIQPAFSPDGRWIVFTSNRVSFFNFEIFRVRARDGGGAKRLTFWGTGEDGAPGDDVSPSYSPDGARIAFASDRDGGYAVWTMDAAGRDLREVTRHPGYNVVFPRFSADGRSLVYTAFGDAPGTVRGDRLWTVRTDGKARRALGPGSAADW